MVQQHLAAIYQWFITAFVKTLAVWGVAWLLTIVWTRRTKMAPCRVSFTRPGREAVLSLLVLVAILPLLFLANAVIDRARDASFIAAFLVQTLSQALIASPAVVTLLIRRQGFATAGLSKQHLARQLLLGLCLAVMTVLLFAVIRIPGGNSSMQDEPLTVQRCIYLVAVYAVSALGHEFVYRGYLQTRLMAWGGETTGLLLSSLVYAVWHLPGFLGMYNLLTILVQLIGLFALGLVLGEVRRRSGSIIPSTFLHAASDISLRLL
jgi:membrane protease YdiL (CAAX protease family)